MLNIETTKQLVELKTAALILNKSWTERQSIDWSEAEEFVELINKLPEEVKKTHPEISNILEHALENEDWDSGQVANWPDTVIALTVSLGQKM